MSAGAAVSRRDRTLLALVAVFTPSRASSLLSRLGGPEAEPLLATGTHLASLPRRERLLALAAALDELAPTRPWAGGGGSGNPPRPALTRLLEEEALDAREAADGPPCAPVASR